MKNPIGKTLMNEKKKYQWGKTYTKLKKKNAV